MTAMLPLALLLSLGAAGAGPGFDEILEQVGSEGHDALCAQMQAWVDAHPGDPQAARGLVWMAELRLSDGRADLARPLFTRAAALSPGSEWGHQGAKGLADLDAAAHRYGPALATYDRLAAIPDPYWSYIGRASGASARRERVRWFAFVGLAAALALGVALRLWRARGALWPPPEEASYALPVVAMMLLAAAAQPPAEARAVSTVAVGALALLYAHGVHLRARPEARGLRVLEGGLGLLEAVALLYCAVVANDLWLKFAETLVSGAER
jgi:hypothetical protein